METNSTLPGNPLPSQRMKCLILSQPKLKVDPHEGNSFETIVWQEEKIVGLYLKTNREETNSDDEFIESPQHTERIETKKEELDQKESDLCFEQHPYMNWETRTFRNADKAFDSDVMDLCAIKEETKDVNEELLSYTHESLIKTEFIEQEEVHIKEEENNEIRQNEKIPKEQTVMYQCPECPYSSNRRYHLKEHSIKHKKKDEIDWYSCQDCSYKTNRGKRQLMRHTEIHNNVILKCSKCSYETLRSSELKKHQIEHNPNIQLMHCPKCSFKTRIQLYYRKHLLIHNAFKCPNCPYETRRKDRLAIHQLMHESMDKWHSCSLCSFKTHNKQVLKGHYRRRHSYDPNSHKQIEILKCTDCSYETGCKNTLKTHQLIHDPSSRFQCSDCVYNTPHKNDLRKHQVRHQGENARGWHKCPECSYKTVHKNSLRKHVISHKSVDEIQWFECSQCSFKTAHKNYLKRHQLLKHKEAHEIKWFFCYHCSHKTKYKASLAKHVLEHKKPIEKGNIRNLKDFASSRKVKLKLNAAPKKYFSLSLGDDEELKVKIPTRTYSLK